MITDPLITYGKITETKSSRKESSFLAEVPLQSPVTAGIFLP